MAERREEWVVKYYRRRNGSEPVREFIAQFDAESRRAIDNYIGRLVMFGPVLNYPSSSQVEGELRELRPDMGNTHYRILYRRSRDMFILLHGFIKRGSRIERSEIEEAERNWVDFQERMGEDPRRPPSPLGHTAP